MKSTICGMKENGMEKKKVCISNLLHFRYLKDLKHKDDYIGRVFISLKDILPQGQSLHLQLYSHTGKHQRGNISVHLSIRGQVRMFSWACCGLYTQGNPIPGGRKDTTVHQAGTTHTSI